MINKKLNYKSLFNNIWPYIIILLASMLIISPKMLDGTFNLGADGQFHSSIVSGYQQIFKNGNWDYNGIIPVVGFNMGYGTPLFYQTTPHLLAGLISCFISSENSIFWAMDVTYFLNYLVSGITFYLLANALFKNKVSALFSSCLYMIAPYHLSQVYTSDAFSQIWAYAFLPLVFLGVYYLINNDLKKFLISFTIGLSLSMYSHLMTTFFILVLTAIPTIIFYFKKIFTLEKIKYVIVSILLVLLITSPITSNLLYLKFNGNYQVFQEGHMKMSGVENTLLNPLGFVFYNYADNNFLDTMSINLFALIGCIFIVIKTIIGKLNFNENKKRIIFITITTLFMYLILSKYSPLKYISEQIQIIQFVTRLMPPAIMGTSLLAGYALLELNIKKWIKISIILFSCIYGLFQIRYIPHGYESGKTISLVEANKSDFDVMVMPTIEYINVIGTYVSLGAQKEYMPVGFELSDFRGRRDEGIISIDNKADIFTVSNTVPELEFIVINVKDYSTIELPRVYYPGYKLVNTNTNQEVEVKQSKSGLLETVVENGNYKLEFKGNSWWQIARWLRLIGIIMFIGVIYLLNKRNEK